MARLFERIAIGGLSLPNRIVIAPMCQYSAKDGQMTDWHLMHLGQLAISGAGVLTIEAAAVLPEGRITYADVGLYDDTSEAAMARVLAAVRQWSDIPVAIQLAHAGRKASTAKPWDGGAQITPDATNGWQTVAPSALPFLAAAPMLIPKPAQAATRAEINADVSAALVRLRGMDNAAPLFRNAKAVLVFPRIVSGGFIVGGQFGEGALVRGQTMTEYFNIAGLSFGLLAGAQASGLAMFFMTDAALRALMNADGWEIGTGPTVVALDRGLQANATSTTLSEPVYAITFGQQGLMAAVALNGTKIPRIHPS